MDTTSNPMPIPTRAGTSISDIRARVLAEHARLRNVIAQVDRVASVVAAGDVTQLGDLRERAEKLYRMLAEHIDREEAVVAPIIERIDAWGPVRVEQMQHEHVGQRMALEQAAHDLDIAGRPLGQAVQSMCWEILHDMKREEHDLLHPDLWRDELIRIDIGS